jgi:tellurite resistance protein TerC
LLGTRAQAEAYLAGYLVERALSLDNVFVFLIVFQAFAVPEERRPRLLTYGILAALVLRAIFIVAGAAALHSASWLSFPFAALLAWTGWRLWQARHEHGGEEELVEKVKGRLGRLGTTGAALVAIAVVDLIFAVDSVPAILAITTDTFIVLAANAFALLGLRPLFFLVADLVERLYYLKAALATLLLFIAAKMALGEIVGKLSPGYSLAGVALILGVGTGASLLRKRAMAGTPRAGA